MSEVTEDRASVTPSDLSGSLPRLRSSLSSPQLPGKTDLGGGTYVALRDKMAESSTQFLRPGEQIQAVIGGQTASQFLAALTGVFIFLGFNKYRIMVATNQRILILDAGKTSMKKARGVVGEAPRSTHIGPVSAALWHVFESGGEKLRIHRRFFKDIETADAAAI